METPINISEDSSWLSDLKMVNGYILSDKDCNLNLNMHDAVEEEFLSNDIASVFALEKPFKQMKTMDHSDNDNIADKFSLKSATSVFSYQLPQILTFDNPNPTEFYGYYQKPNETVTSASLGNRNFSAQKSKGSSKTSPAKRSPVHIKDHIMAERKRREMLSQSFIALAALIPDLKKLLRLLRCALCSTMNSK